MTQKGFFASLLDLSFTSLVTTKIVKAIYVLSLVGIALSAGLSTIAAFRIDSTLGAAMLLLFAPAGAVISAVYARVILEFVISVFRIAEYQRDLLGLQRAHLTVGQGNGQAPAAPPVVAPNA